MRFVVEPLSNMSCELQLQIPNCVEFFPKYIYLWGFDGLFGHPLEA